MNNVNTNDKKRKRLQQQYPMTWDDVKAPVPTIEKTSPALLKTESSSPDLGNEISTHNLDHDHIEAAPEEDIFSDELDDPGDAWMDIFIVSHLLIFGGLLFSFLALNLNPGNSTVQLGVYIYWVAYVGVLNSYSPFMLIVGGILCIYMNIFEDATISYGTIFKAIAIGVFLLCIRRHITKNAMSIIKKVSWSFMLIGPALMLMGGAAQTGMTCFIASSIMLFLYAIFSI